MQTGQSHRHHPLHLWANQLTLHVSFVTKWATRQSSKKLLHFLDKKVNDRTQVLDNKRLLSKLSTGDLIIINAVYHRACLTRLYRKVETVGCDIAETHNKQVMRAHVLNELLDFIEDNCGSGESLTMAHLISVLLVSAFSSSTAIQHALKRTLSAWFLTARQ